MIYIFQRVSFSLAESEGSAFGLFFAYSFIHHYNTKAALPQLEERHCLMWSMTVFQSRNYFAKNSFALAAYFIKLRRRFFRDAELVVLFT